MLAVVVDKYSALGLVIPKNYRQGYRQWLLPSGMQLLESLDPKRTSVPGRCTHRISLPLWGPGRLNSVDGKCRDKEHAYPVV